MINTKHFILAATLIVICASQRSPFAGLRPIGFPILETTTSGIDTLGNKFGETTTTQRLPLEALGDRELVNRLGQLPQDQQPFWLLNWQALENQRKGPQTYPLRPSVFSESIFSNSAPVSSQSTENQKTGKQNNAGLNNRSLQITSTNQPQLNEQTPNVSSGSTFSSPSPTTLQVIENQNNVEQNIANLNGNETNTTTTTLPSSKSD